MHPVSINLLIAAKFNITTHYFSNQLRGRVPVRFWNTDPWLHCYSTEVRTYLPITRCKKMMKQVVFVRFFLINNTLILWCTYIVQVTICTLLRNQTIPWVIPWKCRILKLADKCHIETIIKIPTLFFLWKMIEITFLPTPPLFLKWCIVYYFSFLIKLWLKSI